MLRTLFCINEYVNNQLQFCMVLLSQKCRGSVRAWGHLKGYAVCGNAEKVRESPRRSDIWTETWRVSRISVSGEVKKWRNRMHKCKLTLESWEMLRNVHVKEPIVNNQMMAKGNLEKLGWSDLGKTWLPFKWFILYFVGNGKPSTAFRYKNCVIRYDL